MFRKTSAQMLSGGEQPPGSGQHESEQIKMRGSDGIGPQMCHCFFISACSVTDHVTFREEVSGELDCKMIDKCAPIAGIPNHVMLPDQAGIIECLK